MMSSTSTEIALISSACAIWATTVAVEIYLQNTWVSNLPPSAHLKPEKTRRARAAQKIVTSRMTGVVLLVASWTLIPAGYVGPIWMGMANNIFYSTSYQWGLYFRILAEYIPVLIGSIALASNLRLLARAHLSSVLHSISSLPAADDIVLYLRAFADDQILSRQVERRSIRVFTRAGLTAEEQLARTLAPFGRMVALGRPGDILPPPGASRHYAADQTWKVEFDNGLRRANLIVLAAGPGRSLRWEVGEVVRIVNPRKLLLLITGNPTQYREFREFTSALFSRGLPEYPEDNSARPYRHYIYGIVYFEHNWEPVFVEFKRYHRMRYTTTWLEAALPQALADSESPLFVRVHKGDPSSTVPNLEFASNLYKSKAVGFFRRNSQTIRVTLGIGVVVLLFGRIWEDWWSPLRFTIVALVWIILVAVYLYYELTTRER